MVLDRRFFTPTATTVHKNAYVLESYKAVYARSTMVLFSRKTKTPLAALSFQADDLGCLSMLTGRPAPSGASGPYFQGMLNIPNQTFTFVISNISPKGMINFNVLHTPHRVSTVDPGPAFGVNQVNELHADQSYTVEADQRANNCKMILAAKTKKVEEKEVAVTVKESEAAEKPTGLYFYLSVVPDKACKELADKFAEGTVWKGIPGFVRRVPKPPELSRQSVRYSARVSPQSQVMAGMRRGQDGFESTFGCPIAAPGDIYFSNIATPASASFGMDYDSDEDRLPPSPQRRPDASVGGDDPYGDSRPDPGHHPLRTIPSYNQSMRDFGTPGCNSSLFGGSSTRGAPDSASFGNPSPALFGAPASAPPGGNDAFRSRRNAENEPRREEITFLCAKKRATGILRNVSHQTKGSLAQPDVNRNCSGPPDPDGGLFGTSPEFDAYKRSNRSRCVSKKPQGSSLENRFVEPVDVGSTHAGELKYGRQVEVSSQVTGHDYAYEYSSEPTVLCLSIWEGMQFLGLPDVEKELEEEVQEWMKNEGKALIESLNAVYKSETCVIDLESDADTVICTCGHQCVNHANVGNLRKCPVCRSSVTAFVRDDGILLRTLQTIIYKQ